MKQRHLSLLVASAILFTGLVGAGPAQAQLRSHELRFIPPTDARVVGFHVYVSGNSMSYADWRDDLNFVPPVDGSGAAAYLLTGLEAHDDVYIALKSYDASGAESGFSNEIVLAAQATCTSAGCNDGNPCTRDTCGASGCVFDPAPLSGSVCDDGNAGTYDDRCGASGICAGTPGQCNVDADCPASSNPCAGPRACSNHVCVDGAPRPDGTLCSDGNESTRYDICESGICRGYACGSDAHCSDGQACNGAERCSNRTCVAGTPMICSDGNVCNGTETCSGSACVSGNPLQCPLDGGPCFDAFCDPVQGCRVQTHPDGSTCTTTASGLAGQCASGLCVADAPPPPDEEVPEDCATAYGPPSGVHQAHAGSSDDTRRIVWSAPLHPMGATLEYREDSKGRWTALRARPESSRGCDAVWSATVSGLRSRVRYSYRVSGAAPGGPVFSETFALRAGPGETSDRFRFAFFANNGLNGSPLSNRAARVISQIRYGEYPLVLGGGGYALSAEAIAAGTVADAPAGLRAWKQQAIPIVANSILAPVLGDTEVESYLHGERAEDYAEFRTDAGSGSASGGNRSFDFGGVHFAALHAPSFGSVHPLTAAGAATLAWLDADLASARASGARWMVVYMHADLLSSERGSGITVAARRALGAILQRHGANLLLSGEGNSFERSRALQPDLETPTPGVASGRVVTARDGIVLARTGSSGRVGFGRWLSATPPAWSAVRENQRPVYLSLKADDRSLVVIAFALEPNGRRSVIDVVEIR